MVLQCHVANKNHYISITRVSMATKLGRMIASLDGLLPIMSHDPLITWPCEIRGSLTGWGSAYKRLCRHRLLVLFETLVKCSSNVNQLSNVNPKYNCNFLEQNTSWAWLLRSGLKFIFHWKAHCFILARSLLSSEGVITESGITEKREVSSEKT